MMQHERFVLPEITIKNDDGTVKDQFRANFYSLWERRHLPGTGERIDIVLHEIEEANGTKLRDASKSVFQDISFNTDKLGEEKQKNTITGIPAAILLFKKQKTDDKVLFINASRAFKAGKNQNLLTHEDIQKIVDACRTRQNIDKYAYLATLNEIKENDYNLNIPRYVDIFEEEAEIDLMAVRKERQQLKVQLAELEEQMEKYLEELGYGA